MKHLVILFYIISYTVGLIAIGLCSIAMVKFKKKIVKAYLVFTLSLTGILLQQTILIYQTANFLDSNSVAIILRIIETSSCGLMIYALPLLIYNLLGKEYDKRLNTIWITLGVVPEILLIVYFFTPYKNVMLAIVNAILFLDILYCLFISVVNFRNIPYKNIKKVLKAYLVFAIVMFPYMLLDSKIEHMQQLGRYFPYGLLSVPIFYFVWNSLSIYLGFKYLSVYTEKQINDNGRSMDAFYAKYNITNREKEIINLLLKGNSYEMISKELVISLTTVKTHVHNIYQKTQVNNKMGLANLITSEIG